MTVTDFMREVFAVAAASPICSIPSVRCITPTAISVRVPLEADGFVDAFYNEETGTTAYALIQGDRRVFGADNTGGWHIHPFEDTDQHDPLDVAVSFSDFIREIERNYGR